MKGGTGEGEEGGCGEGTASCPCLFQLPVLLPQTPPPIQSANALLPTSSSLFMADCYLSLVLSGLVWSCLWLATRCFPWSVHYTSFGSLYIGGCLKNLAVEVHLCSCLVGAPTVPTCELSAPAPSPSSMAHIPDTPPSQRRCHRPKLGITYTPLSCPCLSHYHLHLPLNHPHNAEAPADARQAPSPTDGVAVRGPRPVPSETVQGGWIGGSMERLKG